MKLFKFAHVNHYVDGWVIKVGHVPNDIPCRFSLLIISDDKYLSVGEGSCHLDDLIPNCLVFCDGLKCILLCPVFVFIIGNYEAYERSFDQSEILEENFDLIAKEITSIFPSLSGLRWKNVTDFYTLFLTFYDLRDSIPFSSDNRQKIREQLEKFANAVTKILSFADLEITEDEGLSGDANLNLYKKYATGVRASTDIRSRKNRQEALTEYLKQNLDI